MFKVEHSCVPVFYSCRVPACFCNKQILGIDSENIKNETRHTWVCELA